MVGVPVVSKCYWTSLNTGLQTSGLCVFCGETRAKPMVSEPMVRVIACFFHPGRNTIFHPGRNDDWYTQ